MRWGSDTKSCPGPVAAQAPPWGAREQARIPQEVALLWPEAPSHPEWRSLGDAG